ncbi:RDD family protein [Actinomadura rugatobispora]|uniref:RDD family protein n=1 Tax=Actinomadura rugatobispora TaxID=1994 RepID=A0ABW1A2B0_9ACTN
MPQPLYVPSETPVQELPQHDDRVVLVLASTRRRVVARLVDLLATCLTAMAVLSPAFAFALWTEDSSSALMAVSLATAMVLVFPAIIALRVGRYVWWGCTVGQRVAGLRVVCKDDGTSLPNWRQAFRRWIIPQQAQGFPLVTDFWTHKMDKRLGQCVHDQKAGTVVVRALPDERTHRIVLGSALGVIGAAVVATPLVFGALEARGPAFEVNTFYDDDIRFENRRNGLAVAYERTAAKVLDDEKGCLAGATTDQARSVLRQAGCEGRIEAAFRTTDGVLVGGHVLKFPDAAAASTAQQRLTFTDLRFVPGGRIDPPGGANIGQVGDEDRYVVVTMAVSPKQPEAPVKAKNAFALIHAPVLSTIVWF